MALQVWLPLNGSLMNQGVDTPNIISHGLTYSSTSQGKVTPQAAKFSGDSNQYIHVGNTGDYQYENFTWTCWIYPTQHASMEHIISNGRDYDKFGMNLATSNGTLRVLTDSVYLDICSLSVNTWYHVALTKNGTKLSCYVNGTLTRSTTISTPDYTYSEGLTIGKMSYSFLNPGSYFPFYGLIQDVRIYDNALSDREIKEISKGLVCHYTLSDINATSSVNKYSGETVLGKANSTDFTMSKNVDGEGYKYTLSYTGTGGNKWYSIGFPTASFEVGKTYDYSCKIRCNSANFALYMRSARCGNDWAANTVNVSNADGKWHEYYIKQRMTGTTFERSGSSDVQTTRPLLEFYTQSLVTKGTVYKCDFDIKDVQISECSEDAPISNASWSDGILYDSSGNGNHGNVSTDNNISISNNSPRYDNCYKFLDGAKNYINTPNFLFENFTKGTMSVWINRHAQDSTWRLYLYFANAFNWVGNELDFIIFGSTGSQSVVMDCCSNTLEIGVSLNVWNHFAITWDLSTHTAKYYVNGSLQRTVVQDGINTTYASKHGNHMIGNSYGSASNYSMSDFRLYATALSDADIKELYETPVSLTNTGTLMTQGEYKEI